MIWRQVGSLVCHLILLCTLYNTWMSCTWLNFRRSGSHWCMLATPRATNCSSLCSVQLWKLEWRHPFHKLDMLIFGFATLPQPLSLFWNYVSSCFKMRKPILAFPPLVIVWGSLTCGIYFSVATLLVTWHRIPWRMASCICLSSHQQGGVIQVTIHAPHVTITKLHTSRTGHKNTKKAANMKNTKIPTCTNVQMYLHSCANTFWRFPANGWRQGYYVCKYASCHSDFNKHIERRS